MFHTIQKMFDAYLIFLHLFQTKIKYVLVKMFIMHLRNVECVSKRCSTGMKKCRSYIENIGHVFEKKTKNLKNPEEQRYKKERKKESRWKLIRKTQTSCQWKKHKPSKTGPNQSFKASKNRSWLLQYWASPLTSCQRWDWRIPSVI